MTARLDAAIVICAGLDAAERAQLAARIVSTLDVSGLRAVPVAWFLALGELAKADPYGAGALARAMYQHLSAFRPESPAPLDHGFVPTEPERDPRSAQ